jgi:GxxExxY protein
MRKLRFVPELSLPIVYKEIAMKDHFRIHLLVECLANVHHAQVLTYLKLTDHPCGLLINFNVPKLVDGVKRVLNTHSC